MRVFFSQISEKIEDIQFQLYSCREKRSIYVAEYLKLPRVQVCFIHIQWSPRKRVEKEREGKGEEENGCSDSSEVHGEHERYSLARSLRVSQSTYDLYSISRAGMPFLSLSLSLFRFYYIMQSSLFFLFTYHAMHANSL